MKLNDNDLLKLYRDMLKVRLFEGRLQEAFKTGVVPGFLHLGIGQEACMAGTCLLLEEGDTIGATHREHGVLLCQGSDPNAVMAEIYGKATGICKGKGGSMHACDMAKGCLGNNAILGPGQTIINGYAFANKYRENKKVAVSMFGEGASNRGEFHEGMNFAALWELPTIYVLQDNRYALSTTKDKQHIIENLSIRAEGYGMHGETVDGNDVLAVVDAFSKALKRARAGEGPTLLEYKTYKWRGHFEGQPLDFIPKGEIEWNIENNDPIKKFEKVLFDQEKLNEKLKKEIYDETVNMVDKAQKFAEESPLPDEKEIYTDVYFYEEGRDVQ